MTERLVWRGTPEEYARLVQAVDANCESGCKEGTKPQGVPCPVHDMLHDQAQLNHLGCAAAWEPQLIMEEFSDQRAGGQTL